MKKNMLIVLAVLIVGLGAWYVASHPAVQPPAGQSSASSTQDQNAGQPIATAHYVCDGGKTIDAAFYNGPSKPPASPDQPPIPGGSANVSLSDGRTFTLQQTISADGARYSDGDPMTQGSETFVFWSKGNGALVLENNEQKSYIGCIAVVPNPGNLPQVYENGTQGFSIRYPAGYTANPGYTYQEMGPGKDISGVSFTIPTSTAAGTNLGQDSYISIEELPQANQCSADLFLEQGGPGGTNVTTMTDNGTDYSVASSTGAGAGNRYEETVYALPGTNPCIAVRYFIHYSVLENYPPGMVVAFDRQALTDQFAAIRRTLTIGQ